MKRLAVCVGINDYPGSGNDLNGCVNDAIAWAELLSALGYEVIRILDSEATRSNVITTLKKSITSLRFADRFVFTNSSHGSWVPDRDLDEADGRDEVLVMYDWENQGFISDDDLYTIYQDRNYGVRVMAISDSCHSGTVARLLNANGKKARFFEPDLLVPGASEHEEHLPRRRNIGSRPGTLLLSGCADNEVSYDAYINGKYQGAMSYHAIHTWLPHYTMKSWYNEIRKYLPNDRFDQTPQLQASAWQQRWRF